MNRQSIRYSALALQVTTHSVGHLASGDDTRRQLREHIARLARTVAASTQLVAHTSGSAVRLVVLPEYALTGSPTPGRFAIWRTRAALVPGGAEYEALGRIAQDGGLYLAGNAYEADPAFPELYFQACFIIGPAGDVILRYRRIVSLYSPSPYDVLQRYLDLYGPQALFPVVDTDIGRLAAVASEEILYPEIARCHAMRGAEILVHSTSEMGSPRPTAKDIAKRARAAENLAYVVSANAAGVVSTPLPTQSTTGMAKIVDYEGRILAAALGGGDSLAAHAEIDLHALRARRRQPGLTNVLVRQPFQAYAESYRSVTFHAAGQLEAAGITAETATLREAQLRDIERLAGLGLI